MGFSVHLYVFLPPTSSGISHASGAIAGVLVGGAGMELNVTVCTLGILSCIVFYATSKLFIYLFLGEFSASHFRLSLVFLIVIFICSGEGIRGVVSHSRNSAFQVTRLYCLFYRRHVIPHRSFQYGLRYSLLFLFP